MTETVVVMPFLLVVLVLLLFFGRSMVRVQRTNVMARYEVWRQTAHAGGPSRNVGLGSPQLDETFYAGRAESIDVNGWHSFPRDARDQLVSEAYLLSDNTGQFADDVHATLPRGRSFEFAVDHANGFDMLDRFDVPIERRHTRLDGDWRFANGVRLNEYGWRAAGPRVSHNGPIRDTYYTEFDSQLAVYDSNPLAQAIRNLYLASPGYRGPDVDFAPPAFRPELPAPDFE